jgi:DNA mismatch endonuclease, patch repair protein
VGRMRPLQTRFRGRGQSPSTLPRSRTYSRRAHSESMPDIWPASVRSLVMSRIRGRDTEPERVLRSALRVARVRYRSYPKLPGSPDLRVYPARVLVFVHGCFWHGCPKHYQKPATHSVFWARKIAETKRRDAKVLRILRLSGWRVLTVWECTLVTAPVRTVQRIRAAALGSARP